MSYRKLMPGSDWNPDWPSRTAIATLLAAFVSVPFLIPTHHHPIPSFYEEWWAFFLGTAAAFAATIRRPLRLSVPRLAALPGFLLLLIVCQWIAGVIPYREALLLYVGYLVWAGLLLILGATLKQRFGASWLFGILATALLAASLLNAVLGFMQFAHFPLPGTILFPALNGRISANIAQPNLLATYLWIGIAAAIHLQSHERLSLPMALPAVAMLGFVVGLSSSRIGVLEGFLLLCIGIVFRKGAPKGRISNRSLLILCALAFLAIGAVSLKLWPVRDSSVAAPTVVDRLSPKSISGEARIALWRDTLTMIGDHPWAGNGVGNYPWGMVESAAAAAPGLTTYPGVEHSHNALLQIAADFGVPALIVCLLIVLRWAHHIRPEDGGDNRWGIDLLAIIGLHSMVEYPLWDAGFLGLAALAAGAVARQRDAAVFQGSRRLLSLCLAVGMLALLPLRIDYGKLDQASNFPAWHHPSDAEWKLRIQTVAHLATHSGLGGYANIALGVLLVPEKKLAPEQSLVCERAMTIWPLPTLIAKCAVLRLLLGKRREADALILLLTRAYRKPEDRRAISDALRTAEKKNPEVHHLGVLLESAQR